MEIVFPLEFIVRGTPVSLSAKRAESRTAWKDHVRTASTNVLPSPHLASILPLAITLFYFSLAEMQGDVDNIVKPILDALCRHVYVDDHQIERVWVQKFAAFYSKLDTR